MARILIKIQDQYLLDYALGARLTVFGALNLACLGALSFGVAGFAVFDLGALALGCFASCRVEFGPT